MGSSAAHLDIGLLTRGGWMKGSPHEKEEEEKKSKPHVNPHPQKKARKTALI